MNYFCHTHDNLLVRAININCVQFSFLVCWQDYNGRGGARNGAENTNWEKCSAAFDNLSVGQV